MSVFGQPWFDPGFCLYRGSYQGCPLPPQTFTELQTKHTLPVSCSLDQHGSCLCVEDMCLGLREEAVFQTVKALPNRTHFGYNVEDWPLSYFWKH